ncbi:MAG: Gfo/Idh/MocA family oxidoreductase [Phycisphaerales bacterium]
MNRIKIGQIGITHEHASGKMDTLRRLPELYEVVGVVAEEDADGRECPCYEGLEWMTEEQLLDTPGLQAIAVETDMTELAPTALRCMERGLHMHLDKPGGETLEPFRRLLDGCQAKGLALQLGYMYRTNPAIKLCFKALREGWLGDIFEVHTVMSRFDDDEYRQFLSRFPGGAMFNFGSHLIDLVVALLGRPTNVVSFQQATRADGLHDNGLAVLEYPRATATVRASIVEVDGMKHRRLIVCGTKGTAEICPLELTWDRFLLDPLYVRLTLSEDNPEYAAGTHLVNVGSMNYRYDDQLIELARIIKGEIENPYTYEHDFLVQETLLAAAGYTQWAADVRPIGR